MNFDEMLDTWRAQDKAPIYRVNRDLLQVVVRQDYAEIRRGVSWNLAGGAWAPWIMASVTLTLFVTVLFAATSLGAFTPTALDFAVTVVALGAIVVSARDAWLSRERRAEIERGFGKSLQEEIRRNLSRIDYQLSRYKSLTSSVLMSAPIWASAFLLCWVIVRLTPGWYGWVQAFMYVWPTFLPLLLSGGYLKKELLEHRRRLTQLLDLLKASE